jgi:error-prone DNA polymerase
LWESELAIQPRGELFSKPEAAAMSQPSSPEQKAPDFIRPMTDWQRMETDLLTTGITIGKHPMAFLREELDKHGVLSSAQTVNLKRKEIVTVAGSVIVRQRPSTAKDVVFITMEDETGYSNFLVQPDVFDRFRSTIVESNFMIIKGIVENETMIKALYFQTINAFIAKIGSHDFQ